MASGSDRSGQRLRIGDWSVEPASGTIRRGDDAIRLEPKVMQVLTHLAATPGEVASKESIIDSVWADTYVGEAALSRCISELRRALGDDARAPRYIETLPKRGYRLVAPVSAAATLAPGTETLAVEPRHGPWKTAAAATIVLALFLVWWQSRPQPANDRVALESIAVLPMRALSDDPEQSFFAEGLTGQLVTELAAIEGLSIVPGRSALGTTAATDHPPEIAAELGVDGLLRGSVQRSSDHILIHLELLHGRTDFAIWAGSYQERVQDDLLRVEQEVAAQAAREIALALAARDGRLRVNRVVDPEALAAYERGSRMAAKETPVDLLRALDQLRRATELDTEFALAWSAVADVQATLAWNNWSRPEIAYADARTAAHTALDLDPTLPEAHALLAAVAAELNQDWLEAERRFRTAIDLDPLSGFARERFARYLRRLGRLDEALEQSLAATEASPESLPILASHAWNLMLSGDLERAAELYLQIIDVDGDLFDAYAGLCAVRTLQAAGNAAVSVCERAAAMPGRELSRAAVAAAWASAGDTPQARLIAEALATDYSSHDPAAVAMATAWLAAGDTDRALQALEQGAEHRALDVPAVLATPYLRPLHRQPRFQALLERLRIPAPAGAADGD